ncbi:MAG TPA: MASE1 domain-containing protein [Candidatus Obscuribacterales bacterium]
MANSVRASHSTAHRIAEALLIAVPYILAGKLGFLLAVSPGNVTAIWPPSGIAFAAAYLCGKRAWLPIWIASVLLNGWFYSEAAHGLTATAALTSAAIATGSLVQAALGAFLLRRMTPGEEILKQPRDVITLVWVAMISCTIAATTGVLCLLVDGAVAWPKFGYTWLTWWTGDTGGVLAFMPLILTWRHRPSFVSRRSSLLGAAASFLAIAVTTWLAFGIRGMGTPQMAAAFLTFPMLIWIAFSFGVPGVTLAVPVIEFVAVCGTKFGYGPFMIPDINHRMLVLEGFLSTISLIGLMFACVLSDWQTTRQHLQTLAQQLEVRVKERTAELERVNRDLRIARDNAIEAFNIKQAFIANISHELRTPLAGILGMSELALHEELTPELKKMIQTIYESGNILLTVVNDILDLSRIEAGKATLTYEPFNPSFLLQDSAKLLGAVAVSKHLKLSASLDTQLPQFVFGDAARIRQVLLNLIGNAVKFTDAGSITVAAEIESETDKVCTIRFTVTDTGIGIKEEEKRLLFMPFVQLDAGSTRRHGGTGLGLAISKRFVEMMNGTIGLQSEVQKGSKFWFSIPFDKTRPDDPDGQAPKVVRPTIEPVASELAANRLVLIVEDVAALRELTIRQLASLGLRSHAVPDAATAIAEMKIASYDLILMDVNLPDMTGYDATKLIRCAERESGIKDGEGVPIIALTAGDMEGDRENALAAGLDDYIAKPIEINLLRSTLSRWLSKRLRIS